MADRIFNNVKATVEFEESKDREQINSKENVSTLFGKIKKWFSDLKTVAFTGSYNDLADIPQYTPKESGIYKITVDEQGNVSSATPVTKQDLLDFGIVTEYDFTVGYDGHLYVKPKTQESK